MKRGIIACIFLLFVSAAFSLPNNFFVSVEPVYSLQNGTLFEYVLAKDSASNSIVKRSELDWELSNLSFLGIKLNGGWKRFSLNLKFTGAIPENSGNMTDYDWLDSSFINDSFYYNNPNLLTTKSINESYLKTDYFFDIYFDVSFYPLDNLKIAPLIGYNYNYLFFHGSNGYGWYGDTKTPKVSWNDPSADFFEKGSLYPIDYERETNNIYVGVKLSYSPIEPLSLILLASVSPYTSVKSLDKHYTSYDGSTGKYFYDIMEGSFCQYNINLEAKYIVWRTLSVNLGFDYNYLNQINGVTYSNSIKKFSTNNKDKTLSACAGTWWSLSLSTQYTF